MTEHGNIRPPALPPADDDEGGFLGAAVTALRAALWVLAVNLTLAVMVVVCMLVLAAVTFPIWGTVLALALMLLP